MVLNDNYKIRYKEKIWIPYRYRVPTFIAKIIARIRRFSYFSEPSFPQLPTWQSVPRALEMASFLSRLRLEGRG
jgi:hypothetical protein